MNIRGRLVLIHDFVLDTDPRLRVGGRSDCLLFATIVLGGWDDSILFYWPRRPLSFLFLFAACISICYLDVIVVHWSMRRLSCLACLACLPWVDYL